MYSWVAMLSWPVAAVWIARILRRAVVAFAPPPPTVEVERQGVLKGPS